MTTSPPPGAHLDPALSKLLGGLLQCMRKADFRRSTLLAAAPQMAGELAAALPDLHGQLEFAEELQAWVRWWRLPGLWLSYLFQLTTAQQRSPAHVVACRLYSEAQANMADDLAYSSLENAFTLLRNLDGPAAQRLRLVEADIRARLELYYRSLYSLARAQSYTEMNPLNAHLYQAITELNFRGAFPETGDPASQATLADFENVIEQCATMETRYYRVLARRFLGMRHAAAGDFDAAAAQYEFALADSLQPPPLETEIGHLRRLYGWTLSRMGRFEDSVNQFEKACRYENLPPYFDYWYALSARELGDARLRTAGTPAASLRSGAGSARAVDVSTDRPVLERAIEAYRSGRVAFDRAIASPSPLARAVKQQLFRSFHDNALSPAIARLLSPADLLAEIEAGAPRQATDAVAEIEACRAESREDAAQFQKARALFHAGLSTAPVDFDRYLQLVVENNAARQFYLRSYLRFQGRILEAQQSGAVAEKLLSLELPGTVLLLFDVGWNDAGATLYDAEHRRILLHEERFGYRDLEAIHHRYCAAVAAAEASFSRRRELFRAALDGLVGEYQKLLGAMLETFRPSFAGRRLVVFPRAQLHAVPFAALAAGGKRLAEQCELSYCQTLGLFLALAARAAPEPDRARLLAVHSEDGLKLCGGLFAELERAGKFEHRVLRNPSFQEFLSEADSVRPADLLFACHGRYHPRQPGESLLGFGSPDGTSFWRLFAELRLDGCRSVVLGACESGLARSELDAEYAGFPVAFHSAGARYVVASLWKVNQLATAILLSRYFGYLATPDVSLPAALRCAQCDLMAMPRAAVLEWLEANLGRLPAHLFRAVAGQVSQLGPYPFAHPESWAGFFVSGA